MAQDVKPRVSPRLRVLLYTSIAFNLLVFGLATGIVFNNGPLFGGERGPERNNSAYVRALNEDQRHDLRDHLRARFEADQRSSDHSGRGRDQIYLDIAAAMKAEPFDAQAVADLFDLQTQRNAERLESGQIALRDFLLALDEQDRIDFADRLEQEINLRAARKPEPPRK